MNTHTNNHASTSTTYFEGSEEAPHLAVLLLTLLQEAHDALELIHHALRHVLLLVCVHTQHIVPHGGYVEELLDDRDHVTDATEVANADIAALGLQREHIQGVTILSMSRMGTSRDES